jgi:hypothetical protein
MMLVLINHFTMSNPTLLMSEVNKNKNISETIFVIEIK